MKEERDELGRFKKGNQVAKGNQGNTNPKFGNSNALKHGFYAQYTGFMPSTNGSGYYLYIKGDIVGYLTEEQLQRLQQGKR